MTDGEATAFFKRLADQMEAPIKAKGPWSDLRAAVDPEDPDDQREHKAPFLDSGMAPQSSQGDIKKTVDIILEWSENGAPWEA